MNQVRIIEVGPRDGLQNEASPVALQDKIDLIERLAAAGLPIVETGSFVSAKWVPQMADSADVFKRIRRSTGTRYAALTPNLRGFEAACSAGVDEVAVFAAASEAFSQKNINCSIAESLARFAPLMKAARNADIPVRAYVSCVAGCPYQGEVEPAAVLKVTQDLLMMGCYEISLGDTIGTGTPGHFRRLVELLLAEIPAERLALHCHNTYGQALGNILVGLDHGIRTFDSAIAGLGGCPYADGASGNVATEDLVYMLDGLGLDHGCNLPALIETGQWISATLNRRNQSAVGLARAA